MDSGQTRLLSILIIAIVLSGTAMIGLVLLQPSGNDSSNYFVTIAGPNEMSRNVTLSEMLLLDTISRNSSYQNTYGNVGGIGIYTGVRVASLLDLIGGMNNSQTLRVVAEDGYSQSFNRSKVYPNETIHDIQGDMILAYQYEGLTIPDYEDGFRLAFLPEDGYYSNEDANATTDPNPAAAGPQWVSNVVRLELLENIYTETLAVNETFLRTLSSISGEGGYKKKSGEIVGPFNFTGVAISVLLQQFSNVLDEYTLIVRSGDGYANEYPKSVVEGVVNGYTPSGNPLDVINSTMILAYELDGAPIIDNGPLQLVFINEDGNLTDGFRWSKDVVSITLVGENSGGLILCNYILFQTDNCLVNDAYITNQNWF
ncbi:hypothetical protein EU528_06940 [Candidatus Thorarchaeota archaeon]|nr:MAG: hypothetical protein EU528_06940 [Candidatus Thorarchaeota archaeon]